MLEWSCLCVRPSQIGIFRISLLFLLVCRLSAVLKSMIWRSPFATHSHLGSKFSLNNFFISRCCWKMTVSGPWQRLWSSPASLPCWPPGSCSRSHWRSWRWSSGRWAAGRWRAWTCWYHWWRVSEPHRGSFFVWSPPCDGFWWSSPQLESWQSVHDSLLCNLFYCALFYSNKKF